MNENFNLAVEQLRRLVDIQQGKIDTLKAELGHFKEITNMRLDNLEDARVDHEARLRSVTDGVVQFKMFAGLASGGSTILSILALAKAFFGL